MWSGESPRPIGPGPTPGEPGTGPTPAPVVDVGAPVVGDDDLAPPSRVLATPTHSTGAANATVEVTIERQLGERRLRQPFVEVELRCAVATLLARTDANGQASFAVATNTPLPARLWCGLGVGGEIVLDPRSPLHTTLVCSPRVVVQGKVVDAAGNGVADATVLLLAWPEPDAEPPAPWRVGRSERDGTFTLGLCQGGRVGAWHQTLGPSAMHLVRAAGGNDVPVVPLQLVLLSSAAQVHGFVRSHEGTPLGHAELEFRSALPTPNGAELPAPPVRVQCDANGHYVAARLAPGPVEYRAKAPGHGPSHGRLTLTPGQVLPYDVTLPRGGRIHGRVTRDEKGAAGARVQVGAADAFGTVRTRSGPDGSYTLDDVGPGPTVVEASHGQGNERLLARTEVTLPPGGEVACDLVLGPAGPAPNLHGKVVGPDGKPIPGCRVSTRMAQAKKIATTTDSQGGFAFHIPSGPVDLRVHRPGRSEPAFADLVQRNLEPRPTPVQLVVTPLVWARCTGRIADAHGNGLPGTIACWHHERAEWVQFRAKADGTFVLAEVPPGTLDVMVEHPGLASAALRDLRLAEGEPRDLGTFTLGRGGTLYGTVRGPGGIPPELCSLAAVADGRRFDASYGAGEYRFPILPAGDYTLLVNGPGLAGEAFPITILADTEKLQDIKLGAGVRRVVRVVLPAGAGHACGLALRVAGSTMRWLDTGGCQPTPGETAEVKFVAWMAPGTYEAVAWTASGLEARQTVVFAAGDDSEVRLTLARK
jgi:hypothetical protein